jgi:alpha,alpha-trehalase
MMARDSQVRHRGNAKEQGMFYKAQFFPVFCSILCLGILLVSHGPAANVATVNVRVDALQKSLAQPPARAQQNPQPLQDIRQYISAGWDGLSRSMTKCESLSDVKTEGEPVLYLPAELANPPALDELQKHCAVRIERLPNRINKLGEIDLTKIRTNGLLYLENPYVVPGGQFNEMYGWDSYFIIRGLLRDNRRALAKGMVDNFFFEIEHYGGVLNANRTYYLTRSQPPFLTSMVLSVYEADKAAGQADLHWLERAYGFALRDYQQWNEAPHLAGDTGLARYFDHGEDPVPEIMADPSHYYRGVARFFLLHNGVGNSYLVRVDGTHPASSVAGPAFPVKVCDSASSSRLSSRTNGASEASAVGTDTLECEPSDPVALTADFYKGDRSMRESGFDVTFRFGPFGADTHHYAPVCLNSLLYKTENDLERMSTLLGRSADAQHWRKRALERQKQIVKYLWDERRGLFFDYNFMTGTRSSYEYSTTFYPLWTGLASTQQARSVARNLPLFEQSGGLAMSRRETQAQWDYPYGWAPIHLLSVEGLRRYGYAVDADRISGKFLTTVVRSFRLDHTIREKYDVVTGSDTTHIAAGYGQNVIGFGWTNGVFLELLRGMSHESLGELDVQLNEN